MSSGAEGTPRVHVSYSLSQPVQRCVLLYCITELGGTMSGVDDSGLGIFDIHVHNFIPIQTYARTPA